MSSARVEAVATLVMVVVVFVSWGGFVGGQNTNFSFTFAASNDSIVTDGDTIFDSPSKSYAMNIGGTAQNGASCGRTMFKEPVQMKDSTGAVASFQTAFTSSFEQTLSPNASVCGDGMAFTFTGSPTLSADDYLRGGAGFCLVNFSASPPDQHVFAVEFDSYNNGAAWKDALGVTASHVGVDVNNNSVGFADICSNGTMPSFCSLEGFCGSAKVFVAWIDYDSPNQTLEVRISEGTSFDDSNKPAAALITVKNLALDQVFTENMYVGFSSSTGSYQDTHRLYSWRFESSGLIAPASPSPSTAVVAGSTVAGVVGALLILCGILWFCKRRRSRASRELQQYASLGDLGLTDASWAFTYRQISRITKNFSESELLASGGFGDVFKGTLASGELVAVKRIKRRKEQDVKSFLAEANSMRQIRHRNLLQLRGWCVSREGLMLVFDFMPNSSLDKWIHGKPDPPLSWDLRRSILAGVASGLAYMHGEWVQCVLHRDIKSSNVMLDADFNAVLGDFGLARIVDHHKLDKTTLMAGTLGYMAPEMQHTGRATKETDVYAFGILVLEILSGRRPLDSNVPDPEDFVLVDSVWRAHEAGDLLRVADPSLFYTDGDDVREDARDRDFDEDEASGSETATIPDETTVVSVLHLGLLCCHPNPSERPTMRDVNQWFFNQFSEGEGGALQLPPLPASRPHTTLYPKMSQEFSEIGMTGISSASQTSSLISHNSALPDSASGVPVSVRESGMSRSVVSMEFGFPR